MAYAKTIGGIPVEYIASMYGEDGSEIPIEERFHSDFLKEIIPWEDGKPIPPVEPENEPPRVEDVLVLRDAKLTEAALRMAPLQDAVYLLEATEAEEMRLSEWMRYRIALGRIEEQPNFPEAVDWPTPPV